VCDGLKSESAGQCVDCYKRLIAERGRPRRIGTGKRSVMVVEVFWLKNGFRL
jgi:hypothetical protein